MRKFVFVGVLVLGLCLAAVAAEDAPTAEVFGGISWLHTDNMGVGGLKSNYIGWDTEFQYNLRKWLGATADIGGNYGHLTPDAPNSHIYSFLFGPTLSYRAHNSTLFVHTLFGANNTNLFMVDDTQVSNTAFALAFGGGADLKINDTFSLRVAQVDYLYTRHDFTGIGLKDHQNNIRWSGGIVINLGRK